MDLEWRKLKNIRIPLYKSVYLLHTTSMSELKEKIRQLDYLNLKNNDTNDLVYEILSEMADRIEKLEKQLAAYYSK